jgi:hypothetical protein
MLEFNRLHYLKLAVLFTLSNKLNDNIPLLRVTSGSKENEPNMKMILKTKIMETLSAKFWNTNMTITYQSCITKPLIAIVKNELGSEINGVDEFKPDGEVEG